MKKVFSIIIALATVVAVNAANTEVARLTLTAQGSAASSDATVRVDPAVVSPETTSYFEETSESENVNIYIIDGASKWSAYKLNEISNLKVGILTNRQPAANQHYTITFKVPTINEGLKLKDLKTGDEVNIVNNGTYEFDVNTTLHPTYVDGTNFRIDERFVINYVPDAPAVLDACFGKPTPNHLIINNNPYAAGKIVVFDGETPVVTKDGTETDIDLTGLTVGKNYTVKFFPTSEIDGKPASRTLIIVPVAVP
jgi:Cu/Ag efflux protein CusF